MFKLHTRDSAKTYPFIYKDAGEVIKIGSTLKLNATGKLVKSAATDVPEFIALSDAASGDTIPVFRIMEDYEFETKLTADGSALVEGAKVTVDATALGVTATTTGGVFTISKILEGGAIGTIVRGYFRR